VRGEKKGGGGWKNYAFRRQDKKTKLGIGA
jgi:hypothetical protein